MRLTNLTGTFFDLLGEIYIRIKYYLFLATSIILLMTGFAMKNLLIILVSLLLLIISTGSIKYRLEEKKNEQKIHKTSKNKLVEPKKAE